MSVVARRPEWADVIAEHAATTRTAQRLIRQLAASEVAGLTFCRLMIEAHGGKIWVEDNHPARSSA